LGFETDWRARLKTQALLVISSMLVALLGGWFLDIFTGEATKEKFEQMVAYCYVFPFICLGGTVLPFFAFPDVLPYPPDERYPIGIVLGCSQPPARPANTQVVPYGILCNNSADQWLINIGGRATNAARYKSAHDLKSSRTVGEAGSTPEALNSQNPQTGPAAAPTATNTLQPTGAQDGTAPANLQSREAVVAAKSQTDALTGPKPQPNPATSPNTDKTAGAALADTSTGEDTTERAKYVIEGLVVPLYFVILSIFGGFVSMLRRVPEYQDRVTLTPNASNYMTLERAREKLVFESIQLLSAPMIAITACYLFDPSSRSSSIALAFFAGFSSETVLLYVRAIAEKLRPSNARELADLGVTVTPTSIDFKNQGVSSSSAPQSVTITNRSAGALKGTITIAGDFAGDFTCAPEGDFTLPAGSSLPVKITFTPTSAGPKRGRLEIDDNAPGSPRIVDLAGSGQS